mmetsp:Transcript_7839/g.11901  ORF Transcript_7839/g.11901 Transcript_7839/m.11901 type:complete len:203 (-) Transcript_7839:79-687(-)
MIKEILIFKKKRFTKLLKRMTITQNCLQKNASTFTLLLLWRWVWVVLVNLSNEIMENGIDIHLCLCGRLQKRASTKLTGECISLLLRDHTLITQITFVAHQHHWHAITILYAQDLFFQIWKIVKGRLCNNRIDQHKSLTIFHVQISHRCKLFSSGGIQNFKHKLLSINLHWLAVRIFNGWIVFFDKNSLHKLYSKCRFSDST